MPTENPSTAATSDGVVEHHPACKDRCVQGCRATETAAFETLSVHYADAPRRAMHKGRPVAFGEPSAKRLRHHPQGADRASPPLWEHVEDWGCVETLRAFEVAPPQPDAYPDRVADDRYNLDRWTRPDGIADRDLDATIAALDAGRKSRVRAAPDVGDLATMMRTAFPAVERKMVAVKKPRPRRRGFASAEDLYEALTGQRLPDPHGGHDWEAVAGQGGIYVGLVWGLALVLFGRESDPLSEHAVGRMLPGVPVREMRAPFSSPVSALFAAAGARPELGGGSLSLEIAMPKKRTWSRWDEIKVHPSHGGTSHVRGEQAVNRCLSARGAVDRAGLNEHEEQAVAILSERGMLHEERVRHLRAVYARSIGIDVKGLNRGAIAREVEMWRFGAPAREAEREAIEKARRAGEDVKPRLAAWEAKTAAHHARLDALAEADKAALPKLLREATADMSDGGLLAWAKAASKRLTTSVRRVTRYHDPLVTARQASRHHRPDDAGEVRLDLSTAPAGLAL